MAVIHNTTMTPTKLELLATWLPSRPWYAGGGGEPELTKAGGFRLDDPEGEVGIEFMVVNDVSVDPPVSYHVPLTYRGAPLDDADHALVGTSEHGVLGRRWVYDGMHDPVLAGELLALLQGRAEAQQQSVNDTPDPTVIARIADTTGSVVPAAAVVTDGSEGTDLLVEAVPGGAQPRRRMTLRVTRVLRHEPRAPEIDTIDAGGRRGFVAAGWRGPDGDERRGLFAVLRDAAS